MADRQSARDIHAERGAYWAIPEIRLRRKDETDGSPGVADRVEVPSGCESSRGAQSLHSIRVLGQDRPGIAAELTQKLGKRGINLRGFVASVIGRQFVAYVGVDSPGDTSKAIEMLQKA